MRSLEFILNEGQIDQLTSDIADLSVFGICVANNGGGTDGMEYSLDAVSASSGDDILVARSVEAMSAYFADCYSAFDIIMVANSNIGQNGDDPSSSSGNEDINHAISSESDSNE